MSSRRIEKPRPSSPTGVRHSARSTQGPDLASALEMLLVDLHVVGTLGLSNGEELGDVLGAAVAESHGSRIVRQVELDLELASVPAGLRGVVVRVDHGLFLGDGKDSCENGNRIHHHTNLP